MNNGNGQILLSKWWRTPSAQRAFERVKQQRAERIAKVRQQFNDRKQQLKTAVEGWTEKL